MSTEYNISSNTNSSIKPDNNNANDNFVEEFVPGASALYIKLGGILMLFVLPLIFGLIPTRTRNIRKRYTSLANCFGGGVFFGTCFLHLIPEVKLELLEYAKLSNSTILNIVPLPELLECTGFILMILLESIISMVLGGHGHSHGFEGKREGTKGVTVMILALAIHSVFEGLAIGVEHSPSVFMQLAGAIVIHKCVVAFALGTKIINSNQNFKVLLILVSVFCICTPIGVGVAMSIMNQLAKSETKTLMLSSGIIQGLSTGFFLYITFAEMLFSEMQDGKDVLLKVLFLTAGVIVIAVSTIAHNYMES